MRNDSSAATPVEALPWLLEAMRAHALVGLGEMHGSATEHHFIRELVSRDNFAAALPNSMTTSRCTRMFWIGTSPYAA